MLELLDNLPIFIGFKLDSGLRRQLTSLEGPDRRYVSDEDSTFLRICCVGEHKYVGKVIHERMTTDRIDDIRRNIFSILNRLCPDTRLPHKLEIFACATQETSAGEVVGPGAQVD